MRRQEDWRTPRAGAPSLALAPCILAIIGAFLIGIEPVDAKDAAASKISPEAIIESFSQGKVWCTSYRARDNSCTSVQRISAKSDGGVEVTVLRGYPFKVKELYPMNLAVVDGLLCADFSNTIDRYNRYVTSNRSGKLLPDDRSFRAAEMARYRESMQKSISGLGRVCWSYSARKKTEAGRAVIQVIGYKDGVKQRVDKRETGVFFEKDHSLSFRHPIYKSSK